MCRFDVASACSGVFDVSKDLKTGVDSGRFISSLKVDIGVDDVSKCESAGKGYCEAREVRGLDRSTRVLRLERLDRLDKEKRVLMPLEAKLRAWSEAQGNGDGSGSRLLLASERDVRQGNMGSRKIISSTRQPLSEP